MEGNFLSQVIDTPTRENVILDLMVTKASEVMGDINTGGSLGCSDHALEEFAVLTDKCQVKNEVRILKFKQAKCQLFKELVSRTPWETVLRERGTQQSWQMFKETFCRAQELSVPRCNKSGKEGKRPAWLSQDLLVKLKGKRELCRQWNQEKGSREEYRDAAGLSRDELRRARSQLELNLAKDSKNNKKGFYRYVNHKRKVKECLPPHPDEQDCQTGNSGQGEGWGTQQVFCLSLHWQPLFPHLWSGWTTRWGLEGQRPSHCKGRSSW